MKKAFTLAEVLVTLLIIGIVAALSIPSLIASYQQHTYKAGLKKAINILNDAVTLNGAIDEDSLLINRNVYNYLTKHMSILKTTLTSSRTNNGGVNYALYTPDGMRFEFKYFGMKEDGSRVGSEPLLGGGGRKKLWENNTQICHVLAPSTDNYYIQAYTSGHSGMGMNKCYGCGSYGLRHNPLNSKIPPCFVVVDVNGDSGPSKNTSSQLIYNPQDDVNSGIVGDVFTIMITDTAAIPFGTIAQKAMYSK